MSSKNLFKLLDSTDKGVDRTYGANGLLSKLFRLFLRDMNIGPSRFGRLMREYINDPRNHVPRNRKDMMSVRGNLGAALSKPQMTWKVFCKGLRFLQIVKIEIAIRAYHSNGEQSDHYTSMMLSDYRKPNEEEMMNSHDSNRAETREDTSDDE